LRVFIDDRCELYGDQGLLEYVNADCSKIEVWEEKCAVELALTESGSTIDRCLKGAKDWFFVGENVRANLYRKSN
jgi:hypothetical protein